MLYWGEKKKNNKLKLKSILIYRLLNVLCQKSLPFIALSEEQPPLQNLFVPSSCSLPALQSNINLSMCRRLLRSRALIFTAVKLSYMSRLIQRTSTHTKQADDPYEDPPDLICVSINRMKASKVCARYGLEYIFHI